MNTQKGKLLIVDDHPGVRTNLERVLRKFGRYTSIQTADGVESALDCLNQYQPDLVLLDVFLPRMEDGIGLMRQIREQDPDENLGIIMMTGHLDLTEPIIVSVRAKVDDYLLKPIQTTELLQRIEMALNYRFLQRNRNNQIKQSIDILEQIRRLIGVNFPLGSERILQKGDLTLDLDQREVRYGDKVIQLTLMEFNLLSHLMENAQKTISCQKLVYLLQKRELPPHEAQKVIKRMIYNLRQKLEEEPSEPRYIRSKGDGYLFSYDEDQKRTDG